MKRFWRSVQRQPALFAAGVLVVMNIVALSGVLHLSGAVIGGINAAVAAVLAFLVGLVTSWQLSHIRRSYVIAARDAPASVVPTASGIGTVVGRDDLCHAIIEGIGDPTTRRPHVLIGGEGVGKTAVLVQLTRLLAEEDMMPLRVRLWDGWRGRVSNSSRTGKVPVPVWLRDAKTDLDFSELARVQFLASTDASLLSAADGERVWRQLRQDDKIVVLADGLEEALIEGSAMNARDDLIRRAVRRAHAQRLPLVIASRPHDPLRALDATIIELDQLSAGAAFEYVLHEGPSEDEYRLEWIMETARIPENPYYLQIVGQLNKARRIQRPATNSDELYEPRLDTRGADRSGLRLRLLQTWEEALINGHFPPGVALSRNDRVATIELLSVLACIGLRQDLLEVNLEDFSALSRSEDGLLRPIVQEAWERVSRAGHGSLDVKLAVMWGTQLELVEVQGNAVRFPHSILQAYLGSRLIAYAMDDADFRAEALRWPGRELLIALVLHSRATAQQVPARGRADAAVDGGGKSDEPSDLRTLLRMAARRRSDAKVLDLYAAALEIDSIDTAPQHQDIAEEIAEDWQRPREQDLRTLEHAKLNLVRRFGEAARTISERHARPADSVQPAYLQLFKIGCVESSYPVRLAAAQEIGAGGDAALAQLGETLRPNPARWGHGSVKTDGQARAAAGRQGRGEAVGPGIRPGPDDAEERDRQAARQNIMQAWLVPMLVGSAASHKSRASARDLLQSWLEFVHTLRHRTDREPFGLSFEIALAQGFKYAANRRDTHPAAVADLIRQAREMLKDASFWFSRLTLVQALCLASLRDSTKRETADNEKDSDYSKLVAFWLGSPDARSDHPFVAEARWLAAQALETRQPEHYIWIDEIQVASQVGSRPAKPGQQRQHKLWIPPSTGWAILHQRAQRLVADVILLLNLADRGEPNGLDARLQRTNRNDLPPCLARSPSPLDPTRTVGAAATSEPGTNCAQACPFELCPYPSKGSYPELSAPFCRMQQALASSRSGSPAAPWRKAPPADLRRFWKEMSQRG